MAHDRMSPFPMPITIKVEEDSDSEEMHCRLCHKAFASPIALRNHARMDHIDAYEGGDPSVWTKSSGEPVVKYKMRNRREQKIIVQKRQQEILSSMEPTSLTSLAANNVSYIIIKSEDPLLQSGDMAVMKKERKEREVKKVMVPKKVKTQPAITGPFECLEASPLGADGACHQIFFSCCEYSLHARAEHARRRRAPRCQVCERALPARPGDPARPHTCETCGDGFETTEELQEHSKLHVKHRPYECAVCHKRFTQQGGVLQHMRMHTGDRPFPCTFCSKAFTQKSGLDQHLRTHTKVKPYRCVVCGKSFIQSVHLKQHMRTHTNVSPFQCGICDKRFKQSSHLNYHLKNHNQVHMSREQRDRYLDLVGQVRRATGDALQLDTTEVEVEMTVEEMEAVEQEIAEQSIQEEEQSIQQQEQSIQEEEQNIQEEEQSIQEEDTYIIGDSYEEMREHFENC